MRIILPNLVRGCWISRERLLLGGKSVDATIYKQIIESVMCLTATWSDIIHAVCLVSWYMDRPKEVHLLVVKRILRYVKGTSDYGLFYKKERSQV